MCLALLLSKAWVTVFSSSTCFSQRGKARRLGSFPTSLEFWGIQFLFIFFWLVVACSLCLYMCPAYFNSGHQIAPEGMWCVGGRGLPCCSVWCCRAVGYQMVSRYSRFRVWLRLPDIANKNIRGPVGFEFQINNKIFSIHMSHYLKFKSNVSYILLGNSKISMRPSFIQLD